MTHFLESSFWTDSFFKFLDFFEKFTEDTYWSQLLGDRVFSLLKRYLINDTLHIYMFVTFLPAVLAALTLGFNRMMAQFEELFYVRVTVGENDLIFTPINEYITKNFKGVHQLKRVRGKTGYNEPQDVEQKQNVFYYSRKPRFDLGNTPIIDLIPEKFHVFEIRYKGYKILVSRSEEKGTSQMPPGGPQSGPGGQQTSETIEIKMRSQNLQKLRSFIQEWIDEYYELRKNKLVIYKCNFNSHSWDDTSYWREHSYKQKRLFSSVVLKKGDQERILTDIVTFKESKEWYSDRGIPYRRGYLLHGPPGTGKTSFIQSLASKVKMNVAILNLSTTGDGDMLSHVLARVPKNSILVIEDVDHYQFEEGTSGNDSEDAPFGTQKKSISVSSILNAIDGIASLEESIIFMTCNDLNSLPPALIRPGRVDIKLHLSYVDDYQMQLLFWKFFCMDVKEMPLEKIPRDQYPLYEETIMNLISGIREQAKVMEASSGINIEISPAELISFFLYHALKFNLHKNPDSIEECFASLQNSIPEFIESVSVDRKQAIEHAKKKNQSNHEQNCNTEKSELATSTKKEE